MPDTYHTIEARIQDAITSLHKGENKTVLAASKQFAVPEARLRHRYNGRPSRSARPATNQKLSDSQELALIQYIDRLDRSGGQKLNRDLLADTANRILAQDYTGKGPAPTVLSNWAKRWLTRHRDIKVKPQKPLAAERKEAHSPEEIRAHFRRFREAREKYGVLDEDIYNVDETGFRIGCGRVQYVLTRSSQKIYGADPDNRESLTSVECISAAGFVLPPMLILAGKLHLEKWFQDEIGLPRDTLFAVSDSGSSNDELSMHWIRHFDKFSARHQRGAWRMLIMDGHGTHNHLDYINYCWNHGIIPFLFPPHTTHLLQPLDVVCFQPMKYYHAKAIHNAVRLGDLTFNKVEFLASLNTIRTSTFKMATIKSAFRRTGLIPWDPNIVLIKLTVPTAERPRTPPSAPEPTFDSDLFMTPTTTRILQQQYAALQPGTDLFSQPESWQLTLSKFLKGSMAQIAAGELAASDLRQRQKADLEHAARKSGGGARSVQKGGVIYNHTAQLRRTKRQLDEVVIADKVAEKAAKAAAAAKKRRYTQFKKELKSSFNAREKRVKEALKNRPVTIQLYRLYP